MSQIIRVGFLSAETCFWQTCGLNRKKTREAGILPVQTVQNVTLTRYTISWCISSSLL